jgi:hypothetical protein
MPAVPVPLDDPAVPLAPLAPLAPLEPLWPELSGAAGASLPQARLPRRARETRAESVRRTN